MKRKLSQFLLTRNGENIPLKIGRNQIHRQMVNGFQFMSKNHAVIYVIKRKNKEFIVLCDDSLNGTYINTSLNDTITNQKITNIHRRAVSLQPDDVIGFGSTITTFTLKQIDTIILE